MDRHIIDVDSVEVTEAPAPAEPATEAPASYDIEVPEPVSARLAFLVYVTPEGKAIADSNLDLPITTERVADVVDMRRACAEVHDDVNIMLTAQQVVNAQMSIAQQMAEQAQTEALMARLNGGANGLPIIGGRG